MKMNQKCVHLILTRFNLAIHFGCQMRNGSEVPKESPWLNEEYLNNRFAIFERYTFPSFQQQTQSEFTWIVLFHRNTPPKFKKRIEILQTKMKQFCPLFLDDEECKNLSDYLSKYIKENYKDKTIISTRVDNDDCVHAEFVGNIEKKIKITNTGIFSFTNGLQYDYKNKTVLKYINKDNHFITMMSASEVENNHILKYNHDEISKLVVQNSFELQCETTAIPMWVEIITNNNFSNALHWKFSNIIVPYELKEEYSILDIAWTNPVDWGMYVFCGIFKVLYYRTKGLISIIQKHFKA